MQKIVLLGTFNYVNSYLQTAWAKSGLANNKVIFSLVLCVFFYEGCVFTSISLLGCV